MNYNSYSVSRLLECYRMPRPVFRLVPTFLQSKEAMEFVKPKLHYTADRIVGNA